MKKIFNPLLESGLDTVSDSISDITGLQTQIDSKINKDGSTPLTNNWDVGSFEVRAQTLQIDVATGTAPLTISSTTKVINLNSDLLDGLHDTGFVKTTPGQTINVTTSAELTTALSGLASAPSLLGNVIISLASGTYADPVNIPSIEGNGYTLTLKGASRTTDVSTTMTGGTAGNATTQATVIKNLAGWGVNAYRGKWIYFTSGANNGKIRVINSNTADTLTLVGAYLPAAPANNDTFQIQSNNADITGKTTIIPSSTQIIFEDININDTKMKGCFVNLIHVKHTADEYLTDDNKWTQSVIYSKESYHLFGAAVVFIYCAGTQFIADRCLFFGEIGAFTALISQGGSHVLIRNGSVIDTMDFGLYCDVGGTAQMNNIDTYGIEPNTNVFIKNNATGENAVSGGVILNDATTFSGNGTNKTPASSTDPAYIS